MEVIEAIGITVFTFCFKFLGVIFFINIQQWTIKIACCNNEVATHFRVKRREMGGSFLPGPIQILGVQNIRRNMNILTTITVFLKIHFILNMKRKIHLFPLNNTRSLSDSRRARNDFSGSFQNMRLKIMKTEEQCMFGNYLLFICCTFPDIAVIGKKCLEAVWRLHNSVLWRPTDRALYFQVVCCLPWCQRKYVARVKRKAPSVLLAVCFSSFARKPVHEFKEPNSGIKTFKSPYSSVEYSPMPHE